MDSNPQRAPDETPNVLANTLRWAPIVIPLAAAMILGVTSFIWIEVLAKL